MREVVPCRELYPQVFNMSIPVGCLLMGKQSVIIPSMDKYEIRRLRVQELIDTWCDGVDAKFADKIDRSPSYVGRMLYEPGKKGRKNISDVLIEVIESKFNLPPGWLDKFPRDEYLHNIESAWDRLSLTNKKLAAKIIADMAESEQSASKEQEAPTKNGVDTAQPDPIKCTPTEERRVGPGDRRKDDLGFDPERRHYYPALNFRPENGKQTDRRSNKK